MPKISNRPLKLLTRQRIWADDYEYLKQLYGDSELGMAGAIREIISEYVSAVKHRTAKALDAQNLTPLHLPNEDKEPLFAGFGE